MKRWLAVVCICMLAAAGCSKKPGQTEKVVRIGAAGPFTGDMAVFGADQLNAMKMAVDEWNARGGV
ncbi:MAG: Leucine isoleucine valine threonine and alanine-binding protein, partial [candidate division CPR2 bacterium GW2011_GWC2_39_10]